ncbi:MAG: undecaprenyl-diphosphate phosphatase [Planctomycetes bacterium]|nr:undecaprenyl-diphosphate phosphatase [Planctomycetota bacterium]
MIKYIILGIIQGLTEFLPVSSSGHLVILKNYLQVEETHGALLEVMLHLGTLIAIFVVFWKDILEIMRWVIISILKLCSGGRPKEIWVEDHYTRLFLLIIIGTIPTGIIALLFEEKFESLFSQPILAAIAIMITGLFLWFTKIYGANNPGKKSIGVLHALIIGTFQGVAITPGISRSGSTISAAAYMGVEREASVRYSFLLCIPAIIGAVVLQIKKTPLTHEHNLISLIVGTAVSTITGYLALRFLMRVVQRGRLYVFSYYCWGFGLASAIFFIISNLHK